MINGRKKLLLIGIDQAIPYLIRRFIDDGLIPNIANLAEEGVIGEAYSCSPCDTPTNWATIATGATTAVHGVTSFYSHFPGESLDMGLRHRSRTQLAKNCTAEYIWDVADNNNLIPFVMNYPAGWPSNFKKGVMSLFTWPIPESLPIMIANSRKFHYSVDNENPIYRLEILDETDSKNQSHIYQATLVINSPSIIEKTHLVLNLINSKGIDYDCIKISSESQSLDIIENFWSKWIKIKIKTRFGILPCIFKIKPVKIDPKGDFVKLECSAVYNTKGWAYPESFGEKLVKNVFEYDLPLKQEVEFMIYGKMKRFLRSAREESLTLAKSIIYMKQCINWDLCYFHYHPLDNINHDSLAYLHKESPVYSENKATKVIQNVETAYKIVDELVGLLMQNCVDKNTTVIFISDHGAIPIWKIANIPLAFVKAGLMTYKWNDSEGKYFINWEKSIAFPYMEPPFVWVNLKGREPQGIVKQSDYEKVRDQIIDTLCSMRDPETNETIVQLALRREEASKYGLDGERVGDVVYFLKPPYGLFDGDLSSLDASSISSELLNKPKSYRSRKFFGAHAYYLPTTTFGDFSVSVPLIINGPGIKKGFELKKIVNLTDIVPTISHILKIPTPKNSVGMIINDIFN